VTLSYLEAHKFVPLNWDGANRWSDVFEQNGDINWDSDGRWMHCKSWVPAGMLDTAGLPVNRSYSYGMIMNNSGISMVRLQNPGQTPLFTDTISLSSNFQWYYAYIAENNCKLHFRHSHKGNFWWMDGHATTSDINSIHELGDIYVYTAPYY
jgi:prepilin-type processing-associated H-X9-DG protein